MLSKKMKPGISEGKLWRFLNLKIFSSTLNGFLTAASLLEVLTLNGETSAEVCFSSNIISVVNKR